MRNAKFIAAKINQEMLVVLEDVDAMTHAILPLETSLSKQLETAKKISTKLKQI